VRAVEGLPERDDVEDAVAVLVLEEEGPVVLEHGDPEGIRGVRRGKRRELTPLEVREPGFDPRLEPSAAHAREAGDAAGALAGHRCCHRAFGRAPVRSLGVQPGRRCRPGGGREAEDRESERDGGEAKAHGVLDRPGNGSRPAATQSRV